MENKRILKEIAKRWCKGILASNEALVSFAETDLTEEEIEYIQTENEKIADRITDLPISFNANELVKEYFELI